MLSLRLCLRLTILADSLGPDLADKMFNVLMIRLRGAQADLRLRWSHKQSRGTYIYIRVVRKANSDVSIIWKENPSIVKLLSWKKDKLSVNEANRSSQGISCFQIHSHLPKLRNKQVFIYIPSMYMWAVSRIRRLRFSADAQARLSFRCSHMRS